MTATPTSRPRAPATAISAGDASASRSLSAKLRVPTTWPRSMMGASSTIRMSCRRATSRKNGDSVHVFSLISRLLWVGRRRCSSVRSTGSW
ncbi:hypothetical protein CQZ88_08255 [Rhodococcus sp. ENV425]|nr:hypothetical protein CQZ88_08255 [Rhodococcus sp. ENV425]